MSKSLYNDVVNAVRGNSVIDVGRCYEERNNDPAKQVVDFSKVTADKATTDNDLKLIQKLIDREDIPKDLRFDLVKRIDDSSKPSKMVQPDYMFSKNIENNKFSVDISSLDIPSFCEDRGISFMINNGEIDRDYLIDKLIKYILKNENKA